VDRRAAVRERLDVRTLAGHLGLDVRSRTADRWVARCFNGAAHKHGDRNPSLALYADGYHCHGCGERGDVYDLWRWHRGGTFPEAVDALADLAGVEKSARHRPVRKTGTGPSLPDRPKTPQEAPQCVLTPRRREVWRGIWSILETVKLTDQAQSWLTNRGLSIAAAYAHGCRDWTVASAELVAYFRTLTMSDCIEAGLVREDKRKWTPLQALAGAAEHGGLAVPLWHPDEPDAPVGVRWRYYGQPWPTAPKSMAQPGGVFKWTIAGRPMPLETARSVEYWPHYFPKASGGWPMSRRVDEPPTAVLLMEGETDWLAAASCMVDRDTQWRVIPLALCAMSGRPWPDVLTPLVAGADRVVCMFDVGRNPDRPAGVEASRAVAAALVAQIGRDETRRRFVARPFPDDDDAADYHRRRELWPIIESLLGEDDNE
jgi:hypothetical protein